MTAALLLTAALAQVASAHVPPQAMVGRARVTGEGGTMARGESSFKYHLLGQQVRDHTLVVSGLASPPKFFFFFFFFFFPTQTLQIS